MKELSKSQESALKTRLQDIIDLTKGIQVLIQRMKQDHSYINEQYLTCLQDDAGSIDYLVDEIKTRTL